MKYEFFIKYRNYDLHGFWGHYSYVLCLHKKTDIGKDRPLLKSIFIIHIKWLERILKP